MKRAHCRVWMVLYGIPRQIPTDEIELRVSACRKTQSLRDGIEPILKGTQHIDGVRRELPLRAHPRRSRCLMLRPKTDVRSGGGSEGPSGTTSGRRILTRSR